MQAARVLFQSVPDLIPGDRIVWDGICVLADDEKGDQGKETPKNRRSGGYSQNSAIPEPRMMY